LQLLLQSGKVDVNSKDKSGRTPLSWAVKEGHWPVVGLLLDVSETDMGSKGSANGWVLLENKLGQKINIREPGTNTFMTMEEEAIKAVYKSTGEKQLRLCYPGDGNQWTSPFTISTGVTYVKIAKAGRMQRLVRADISLMDEITFVQLSIESESWLLSICNESKVEFFFWQMNLNVDDDDDDVGPSEPRIIRYRLPGRSIMPYAWDYPSAKTKELVISTHGVQRHVKLDKIGSATPLIFTAPSSEKNVIDIKIVADGPRRTLTLSLLPPKGSMARSKT
jgi:vacuolar protein sorting-associated protein 13A/C